MTRHFHMRTRATLAVFASFCLFSQAAQAGPFLTSKPFDITVGTGSGAMYDAATDTISGGTVSAAFGASTLADLKDQLTDSGLSQINANYTPTSGAIIRAGYRGLPLVLSSVNNSSAVRLDIQSIGLNKTFSAQPTRDGNTSDLFDYLKSNGASILNDLQKKLAELSPIDPIAGNPTSMQSRMVIDDFDRSFTQFASNLKADPSSEPGGGNLVGTGITLGSMSVGGITTGTTSIPFSYTVRNDLDPRKQLSFYAPITISDSAGAKSAGINFGVAYRFPMNDEWALMPSASYGITGSADLGAAAAMTGVSVTSQYTMKLESFDLAIGNMIGAYQTSKINAGDYSVDPQISNTVYRNGVLASFPTLAFGRKMAFELSCILTNYTGSALYASRYQEIGIAIGTNKGANSARTYLRAGATYINGENGITGARLNLGYWF